jgi:hypothetical protein
MALTFEWAGYDSGGADYTLVIGSTNLLAFVGDGGYGTPIWVGQYNDETHIRLGAGAGDDQDSCNPHLTNFKYVDANNVVIAGGASATLSTVVDTQCIRITVTSDVAFSVLAARLYAFDGVSVNTPPSNLNFQCFELGNTAWSLANGRGSALALGDQANSALSHEFFVGTSISPTATGASLSFSTRLEVDIQ